MSKLWRTKKETVPNTEPPAPLVDVAAQATAKPPAHFDNTNSTTRAPAVFQAGHQNYADLTASGIGRPTGPATRTPPPSDPAGEKQPTRLVLNLTVPPGCNPVVLVLDGPPTYYVPTKNDAAANLVVTKTKDGTYEAAVGETAAPQAPTIYKVAPKE